MPTYAFMNILMKHVVPMMSFFAQSKGLEFIENVGIDSDELEQIDGLKFSQALVNLLSCAICVTEEGYVNLTARIEDGCGIFDITCSGISLRNEDVFSAVMSFDKFETGENSVLKDVGPGLYLSRKLVEQLGGELSIITNDAEEIKFSVIVPFESNTESNILKNYASSSSIVEPLSETLTEVSKIEGIDVRLALDRISGRQSVLEESIKQTAHSISAQICQMRNYLSSKDLRGFATVAHGLKSALAVIGAVDLSKLASELEVQSRAGRMVMCEDSFGVFAELANNLAAMLKSVFPADIINVKPPGDAILLASEVKGAVECLESFETDDAIKRLYRISEFSFGHETDEMLVKAINNINDFNYREAILVLEKIDCRARLN